MTYNLAWVMVNWLGSKFGLGLVNSHWNASLVTVVVIKGLLCGRLA